MAEAILEIQPKRMTIEPRPVSIETYYQLEEKSLTKNEYHNGIILKIAILHHLENCPFSLKRLYRGVNI